jgi:ankyrin repeat protein
MVRILVENGADVNVTDSEGYTPLQRAVASGHTEIAGILMDATRTP